MANGTLVIDRSPGTGIAAAAPRPVTRTDGAGFDWLMAACGSWLIGGLYLDGWAHVHIPALESFFTPWHAVLYSGYIAGAGALALTLRRNRLRGASRWDALPAGYGLSLVGAFIFFFGGLADMVWHIVFGIEVGVEGPSARAIWRWRSEAASWSRGRSGRGSPIRAVPRGPGSTGCLSPCR
jgi:hypothetical protein